MTSQKQQVRALLQSIETGDSAPVAAINPDKYIQHNLGAKDGLAGLSELFGSIPEGSARAKVARVFQDGEYVFAHTDYDFFGPKIGFDVFRFEDGQIVEHWDNLQETAPSPNPSSRTMIDGATDATDLDKTDANKALVRRFMEDVFIDGKMEALAGYFDGDQYLQHNPKIGDGLSGLGTAMQAMAQAGITLTVDRIHKVLGEGNFVLAISEGQFAGQPVAFFELFRIENGKLAEHWDTIQTIPARSEWSNDNGKF